MKLKGLECRNPKQKRKRSAYILFDFIWTNNLSMVGQPSTDYL